MPAKKPQGLKKSGKGPFRGKTPKGVFQTIDVGSGRGKYITAHARKFPGRKYAAVDPGYSDATCKRAYAYSLRQLRAAKVEVSTAKGEEYLAELAAKNVKTRHVHISFMCRSANWMNILRSARKVLLPNGKIFITDAGPYLWNKLSTMKWSLLEIGLKVRRMKPLTDPKIIKRKWPNFLFRGGNDDFVENFEITHSLKNAFPNEGRRGNVKEKRRNWPRS